MKRRTSRRFRPTLTLGLDQLESRQLLSSGLQVVTSPTVTGATLNAVSAVSPTDIFAVGSAHQIVGSSPAIQRYGVDSAHHPDHRQCRHESRRRDLGH